MKERNPHAVIPSSRRFGFHGDSGAAESFHGLVRDRLRSRRAILDPVQRLIEAAKVVDHRRLAGDVDANGRTGLPMRGDDDHSPRVFERFAELSQLLRVFVMEMNPRPVDKFVKRDPGEDALKKDSQLDAAVAELLKQIQ